MEPGANTVLAGGGLLCCAAASASRERADEPRRYLRPRSRGTGDLPTARGRADGDAGRHDVRSMHVCEGLPSAGFLAVARFPWLSGRIAGPCGSEWGCLTATPDGLRNRDHTVCFIVALIRCNADTPVPTNRAVLRMPVPSQARRGSARPCAVASRTPLYPL
jgi:hypothetical protein